MTKVRDMRFDLNEVDSHRMIRLTEEIQARLEEMALIASRTIGIRFAPDTPRQFTPKPIRRESDGVETGIYINIVPGGSGVDHEDVCFVYCQGRGTPVTWIEHPCGGSSMQC